MRPNFLMPLSHYRQCQKACTTCNLNQTKCGNPLQGCGVSGGADVACRVCANCISNPRYLTAINRSSDHSYNNPRIKVYSPIYGGANVKPASWDGLFMSPFHRQLFSCDTVCGAKMCDEWRDQRRKYSACLQNITNSPTECRRKFGCRQYRNYMSQPNIPPTSPHLTGCTPCWKGEYVVHTRN